MPTALLDRSFVLEAKPHATLATTGHLTIVFPVMAFYVALVSFLRVFVFEYFHGNQQPLQELFQHMAGLFGF
jgi:hypothetical protein